MPQSSILEIQKQRQLLELEYENLYASNRNAPPAKI